MYCYYRGGLTKSLQDKLRRLGEIEVFYRDEDYNGFNGYEFVPDAEVYSLFLWIFQGKELSSRKRVIFAHVTTGHHVNRVR